MRESINNLNTLVKMTGALIVVSSDWRHSHNLGELRAELVRAGVHEGRGALSTPVMPADLDSLLLGEPRCSEIQMWLSTHGDMDYVVLDDIEPLSRTAVGPRLVLCEYSTGFTEGRLVKALHLFEESDKAAS